MEIDTQNTYKIIEDSVPSFNKKENVEKAVSKKSAQTDVKREEEKQVKDIEQIAIQQRKALTAKKDKQLENKGSEKEVKESENSTLSENNEQISIKTEGTKLQFKLVENVDPKTGRKTKEMVVFLLNAETDEIIRRVPPEEVKDSSTGAFLDKVG